MGQAGSGRQVARIKSVVQESCLSGAMKEIFEFRVNSEFASILFEPEEGVDLKVVKVVSIPKDDPRFYQIPVVSDEVEKRYGKPFYFSWNIKRRYEKKELESASLFQLKLKSTFEPAGEECGTAYDETTACKFCGANVTQKSELVLRRKSIPKTDISRTIAGEIVVSNKFVESAKSRGLKGLVFGSVIDSRGERTPYSQLLAAPELELSPSTVAGINPFDLSESCETQHFKVSGGHEITLQKEVYRCPIGHTLGLNLLSEAVVSSSRSIENYDLFATRQKVGVKRGLLRPEPLYLCSPEFRRLVVEEKLTGFRFEIARIDSGAETIQGADSIRSLRPVSK